MAFSIAHTHTLAHIQGHLSNYACVHETNNKNNDPQFHCLFIGYTYIFASQATPIWHRAKNICAPGRKSHFLVVDLHSVLVRSIVADQIKNVYKMPKNVNKSPPNSLKHIYDNEDTGRQIKVLRVSSSSSEASKDEIISIASSSHNRCGSEFSDGDQIGMLQKRIWYLLFMHFELLIIFCFLLFNFFSEATTDDDISEIADEEQETLLTYDILLECTKITPIGKFWRFINLCFCSPIVF